MSSEVRRAHATVDSAATAYKLDVSHGQITFPNDGASPHFNSSRLQGPVTDWERAGRDPHGTLWFELRI